MPIVPDMKDWTWVLERRCPECGFDSSTLPLERVVPVVRDHAKAWHAVLARPEHELRRRPSDDRWSPLEYACHVRDVFRLYEYRLSLMVDQDEPTFPNWDQDASAIDDRYNEQEPGRVADELSEAAAKLAASFDALGDEQWARTGIRSDGAHFTIDTFARYLVHDPVHHLYDVGHPLDDFGVEA